MTTVSIAGVCPGDLNGDMTIDQQDVLLARVAWAEDCSPCTADIDGDGSVTILDIMQIESLIGIDCGTRDVVQLAGNSLAGYPFFEYVAAFNEGAGFEVALDPFLFPQLVDRTVDIYVVEAKTRQEWAISPTLTDVTQDGHQTETPTGTSLSDNIFAISGSNTLSSEAGLGLGRPYDVVVDVNRNGVLDGVDLIDGYADDDQLAPVSGLYVVHDLTLPGPLPVVETDYLALAGTVTAGFQSQNIFYPEDIASRGRLPLIVVSHGNGHNFAWYDHVGQHMASYGYIVMSHANNTGPGVITASTTTLEHLDAFLSQLGNIDGGILTGHVDSSRITLLGHSRGGEGVAIAVDRIVDQDWAPVHYTLDDLVLVSSIAPVDFEEGDLTDPHEVNYHLWTGGSDDDVNGCANCNLCQTFHLHDRAEGWRQSISLHGVGHGDFHNGNAGSVATGPCLVGRSDTHQIMKGYLLPLVKHYVEGNIPARDYLWRQWERFKPIGAPTSDCVVVDLMYQEAPSANVQTLDDFQSQASPDINSSGGAVTFDVAALTEGRFDDNNDTFTDDAGDAMNGMTLGGTGDDTRGVVFEFTEDSFYETGVTGSLRDFSQFAYLSFRAAQATRHPLTTAELGDLIFTVTLRDGAGATRSINIGAYGGGIEEPYQRTNCGSGAGWANEFETIRIRLQDFLADGSQLDMTDIDAVRFEFGPSFGSAQGRIGLDEIILSSDPSPPPAGSLKIVLQNGVPQLVAPGDPIQLTVSIAGIIEDPVPDSAFIAWRYDGGNWQTMPLTAAGGDLYNVTLPAPVCGDVPEFYFGAEGELTGPVLLPAGAPGQFLATTVGVENIIFQENMDTDPGWTAEPDWAFGQPTGMGGSSGGPDPTSGFTGNNVYGYNLDGDYPNSLIETHLTTPAIDCSNFSQVRLEFMRWLGVESSQWDHAYVRVSTDGVNWTNVWENGPSMYDGAWVPALLDISAIAANQPTVFLRWTMGFTDTSVTYCGWNIDDVKLTAVTCDGE